MPVLVSPVGEMAGAAAVPVPLVILVIDVRVGITPVVIVPVVLLRVVIVPLVIVAAVEVVVPNVAADRKLATVIRFKLLLSEASPISRLSLTAMAVSAVRSWIKPEVGVAALTSAASLAAVTSLATPSVKVVPAENEAIVYYLPS